MSDKVALVFGVTGQDGSYLSELLLEKCYHVYGVARRTSTNNNSRLANVIDNSNFELLAGDVTDATSVRRIIDRTQPDEVYNLAAQSHVGTSFDEPAHTFAVVAGGTLNILEALRESKPDARYYQASSSEQFGASRTNMKRVFDVNPDSNNPYRYGFQDENTPFKPQSPYAVAKVAAHNLSCLYRSAYRLHTSSGILFNHESSRRGETFVTKKITKYVARLYQALNRHEQIPKLKLGNIDAKRDWGYAPDYVYAMWLMLQQDEPDDYVIATGETYSVEDFLEKAFFVVSANWKDHVEIDESLFRPAEVSYLLGNPAKAREKLGWEPSVTFGELVKIMVSYDIRELNNNRDEVQCKSIS